MGKPSGRRTVPVRVFLSPAELEGWEAVRASDVLGTSRADWVMAFVWPELERLAEKGHERSQRALAVLEVEETTAYRHGFKESGGRPPHVRRAPRPAAEKAP